MTSRRFCEILLALALALLCLTCLATSQCVTPPNITTPQTDVRFEEGDISSFLECEADGNPLPRYAWRMKTNFTAPSYQNLDSSNRNLTTSFTNGVYQCLATNECGTAIQEFRVIIPRLADFEPRNERTVRVNEGSSAELICNAPKGTPKPSIFWTIDTEPVDTSARVNTDNTTGNLVFANVIPADSAEYICNVKNSGSGQKISKVTALEVAELGNSEREIHGPQIIVSPPEHVRGLRGESLRLECIATGRPTPNVTWTRDGTPIRSQVRNDSYGLALVFDEVDFSDSGIYRCTAVSDQGEDFRTTNVTVKSAPYWTSTPRDVRVPPGSSANIQCTAGGDPTPEIRWLSNGKEVQNNEISPTIEVNGNTVVVSNAEINDTRVLQCTSQNIYGQIFSNIILNTLPMPTEPSTTGLQTTTVPATSQPSTSKDMRKKVNVREKRDATENGATSKTPTMVNLTSNATALTEATTTAVPLSTITKGTTKPILDSNTTPVVSTGNIIVDTPTILDANDASFTTMSPSTPPQDDTTINMSPSASFTTMSPSTPPKDIMETSKVPINSSPPKSSPASTKGQEDIMKTSKVPPSSYASMSSSPLPKDTTTMTPTRKSPSSFPTMSSSTSPKERATNPGKEKQTDEDDSGFLIAIIIPVILVAIIAIILMNLAYFFLRRKGKSGSFSPGSGENSVEGVPGGQGDLDHIGLDKSSIKAMVIVEDENLPLTSTFSGETDMDQEKNPTADKMATNDEVEKTNPESDMGGEVQGSTGEENKKEDSAVPKNVSDSAGNEETSPTSDQPESIAKDVKNETTATVDDVPQSGQDTNSATSGDSAKEIKEINSDTKVDQE